ncbi:Asi2p KNAG_0F01530 [Huiozyma naganishii CBS 8797]|uniref:Uncharacterized protein n=1 Tax=Huiozyma naganishii (strain ATCC MYA-139 / BCRC 22969 / CBS 8797 / KCTC 17520 / NBRC 10181 / NCYC 3082 / Yp74L-3) TaxID=1071383 RepID=J7S8B3_HUIN7|nr:hypothetical protein KNAG_0F01530 [Kazachstania naganishii CBS 8797]CCK70821.1 hypothetical protein KNAG_0F01530 [Kazachstania naganishii CBS 8797]
MTRGERSARNMVPRDDNALFRRFIREMDKRSGHHAESGGGSPAITLGDGSGDDDDATSLDGGDTTDGALREMLDNLEQGINTAIEERNGTGDDRTGDRLVHTFTPHAGMGIRRPGDTNTQTYGQLLMRNLLMLDYMILVMLFPFSLYNVLRSGFNMVTFNCNGAGDDADFIVNLIVYIRYCEAITEDGESLVGYQTAKALTAGGTNLNGGLSLLIKFHNVINYYGMVALRGVVRALPRAVVKRAATAAATTTVPAVLRRTAVTFYNGTVKTTAAALYLLYGVLGTAYLYGSMLFFALCLTITVTRRYKTVARVLANETRPRID